MSSVFHVFFHQTERWAIKWMSSLECSRWGSVFICIIVSCLLVENSVPMLVHLCDSDFICLGKLERVVGLWWGMRLVCMGWWCCEAFSRLQQRTPSATGFISITWGKCPLNHRRVNLLVEWMANIPLRWMVNY